MGRDMIAQARKAALALLLASATDARAAESFNQKAPIAPYGIPADPAQAAGDTAAVMGDSTVAPLPALPPEPAPPQVQDTPRKPRR